MPQIAAAVGVKFRADMQNKQQFKNFLIDREPPKGIDVLCKLKHFAIITYAVDLDRFKGIWPARFKLDSVCIDGVEKGLVSVVPFIDVDFTSAKYPFPKFTMGQTNYRIYIVDTHTREKCVWFLGTTLDSWTRIIPYAFWKLPWYSGRVLFDCKYNTNTEIYEKYLMQTSANWAPAEVEIVQNGNEKINYEGFPDEETALVYLTHPLAGFYYRRDGKLGTYRVWHDKLKVKPASLIKANFGLLTKTGIVTVEEQQNPYSVLVEHINEFTIYLPPKVI